MPIRLINTLATFQSLIDSILYPFLNKFIFMYLDDVLVYSETLEEY